MITRISLVPLSFAFIAGCGDSGGGGGGSTSAATSPQGALYAYTRDNQLARFDAGAPLDLVDEKPLTGLAVGEMLTGMDFRPSTGELIAVSTLSQLYRIDPATAAATPIGPGPFLPAVRARVVGFDVDPVRDVVRILTEADRNVTIDPDTGLVVSVDALLEYDPDDPNGVPDPNVVGAAYSNPYASAPVTTLFAIDLATSSLVRLGDESGTPMGAESGVLHTVGPLGAAFTGLVGFDATATGGALACTSAALDAPSQLYRIDLATGAATLLGGIGLAEPVRAFAVRPPASPRVFGLTVDDRLVSFRPGKPETLLSTAPISGLASGEDMSAIDISATDGRLYGVSSTGRVFRIVPSTAVATPVGPAAIAPLTGEIGLDFNPVVDLLRLTTESGENLRLSPDTGALIDTDTSLEYVDGDPGDDGMPIAVTALAYTDNRFGAVQTTLFGIDAARNALVRVGSPNGTPDSPSTGLLTTIGALGFDAAPIAGFDVDVAGVAYAGLLSTLSPSTALYVIDLSTGEARQLGTVGVGLLLRDLALELPGPARIVGLDELGRLVTVSVANPATPLATRVVTGLAAGESLRSIDYRTSTSVLVGITTRNRVVMLNVATGVATPVGPAFAPAFTGVRVACEFDPVANALRVVSDTGENRVIDLATGATLAQDMELVYAGGDPHQTALPSIVALGSDRCVLGAGATTLYGVDAALDILVRVGSPDGEPVGPDTGLLSTIGDLDLDVDGFAGFDIAQEGTAYLTITPPAATQTQLFRVALATGEASTIGTIGGERWRDMAIVPFGL